MAMVPKRHWMARIALVLASIAAAPAFAEDGKLQVYFISPAGGDVLSSPVTIRIGLKSMGIAPAGVDKPHTGHTIYTSAISIYWSIPRSQPPANSSRRTNTIFILAADKPKPRFHCHPGSISC
jgi:hypothetical protein